MTAAQVCANLLEPPAPLAVERAVRQLTELDALEVGVSPGAGLKGGTHFEQLTPLGAHLAALPVDVRIGKLILFGAIFGLVDETLTIAAALSHRSPFLSPFDKRDQADAAKRSFASGASDHLAVLKAYTEFDATPGQARFEFARENFLGIKSLQTIGQLKRQLLELLSDAGFVPSGLRARHVEAIGRRGGGGDGVKLALAQAAAGEIGGPGGGRDGDWACACGASVFASKQRCFRCNAPRPAAAASDAATPPPGAAAAAAAAAGRGGAQRGGAAGGGGGGGAAASREERRFDLDGELYTRAEFVKEYLGAAEWDAAERPPPPPPSHTMESAFTQAAAAADEPLLKSLLCAALFPQVIVAEAPKKEGKAGGKGGGGGLKFTVREEGAAEPVTVSIHPSSVNAKASRFESRYLVYAEMIKTTQVYVRDCTPVSPFALMLFGGALKAVGTAVKGEGDRLLSVDGWMKFKVKAAEVSLMIKVREELDALLRQKIAKPGLELTRQGQGVLAAVRVLLAKSSTEQ